MTLQGSDEYKQKNSTQFKDPNDLNKQVFALSYTNSTFEEKLKSSVFAKFYDFKLESLETDYSGEEVNPFIKKLNYYGFGATTAFEFKDFLLKASFENAIRYPEVYELFGDGLNIQSNPLLEPEESKNYNLGLAYDGEPAEFFELRIETNVFLRDTENYIFAQTKGIWTEHINLGSTLSKGVDLSINYAYKRKFLLTANATYLDLRDNNRWRNGVVGNENSQYQIRVPNIPYFYGNTSASFLFENLFWEKDRFSISTSESYTHEFNYTWENLADSQKPIVPKQWVTNLDMVYSLDDQKYNVSLAISNLFDAEVFDNFQQLRPGRAFYLKLRYFID